jgi:hypothetical protein
MMAVTSRTGINSVTPSRLASVPWHLTCPCPSEQAGRPHYQVASRRGGHLSRPEVRSLTQRCRDQPVGLRQQHSGQSTQGDPRRSCGLCSKTYHWRLSGLTLVSTRGYRPVVACGWARPAVRGRAPQNIVTPSSLRVVPLTRLAAASHAVAVANCKGEHTCSYWQHWRCVSPDRGCTCCN